MAEGQFQQGYTPENQFQQLPGRQSDMKPEPVVDAVPTPDGSFKPYKGSEKLLNRKALITGADSGIGSSIAILYAIEGADVFITYLDHEEEDAQRVKKRVEQIGRKCHLYPCDLRKQENCKKVIEEGRKALGEINILVLNHAVQMATKDINDLSEDQWLNTFNTNIHPFFFLTKYLRPHLKKGDTIITNASINGYIGRPDLLDYTSTKGAIVSFTRGMANMLVSEGIRVNAVAPGPVWTPLIPSTMTKEMQDGFTAPIGRPSQPSEIATVFVFLASMDSSSITGQTIHANGGGFVTT